MKLDVDFEFEVGESEKHHVSFHWGQMWGNAWISVDGVEVVRERHALGFKKVRFYSTQVGHSEVHTVVIEKTMEPVAGGYRKQHFRVFVDEIAVGEY